MIIRKATEQDLHAVADIYSEIHSAEESGTLSIGWIRDIYPTEKTAKLALEREDLFVQEEDLEQALYTSMRNTHVPITAHILGWIQTQKTSRQEQFIKN